MLVHTTKTYGSHGPGKRSHQKQAALTKLKGVSLLLKYLAAFCVLDNVGATSVATSVTSPPSPPPCATPVDFALVLDESYSMNRNDGPDFMNGPNGTKAFAKELVRHAALKPRSPPTTAHEPKPEPGPEPGPEPEPEPDPEPEPIPR
eukprot:scaffold15446_cov64-Phaeocystis_antarctica.AAC.3